ncbi:hypothetical protein Droror1_Dr00020361 [Drosera rotundifolia]
MATTGFPIPGIVASYITHNRRRRHWFRLPSLDIALTAMTAVVRLVVIHNHSHAHGPYLVEPLRGGQHLRRQRRKPPSSERTEPRRERGSLAGDNERTFLFRCRVFAVEQKLAEEQRSCRAAAG